MKDKPRKTKKEPLIAQARLSKSLPKDYPWKVLGWLTDDLAMFLSDEELNRLRITIRSRNVEDVSKLAEDWGLQSMLQSDRGRLELAARYQLAALLKKFLFTGNRDERIAVAREKFLEGEEACRAYNHGGYMKLVGAEELWMVDVFTYAQSFMRKLLGDELPNPGVMTDRSRHGPGATTGTEGNQVSTYFKFENWPYHCTAGALGVARETIAADERWLGALEDDYRSRNDIPKWMIINQTRFWADVLEVVVGNRIAFVPKDARQERTIAIEPTLNLYLQLGVDGFIRRRLKRWGVDLDSQVRNQELARQGSFDQGDPFVTLDLRNASNSISSALCKYLCPPEWYTYLMKLRSPCGEFDGRIIDYEMMSSMGNGYTFALESAIFTSIIYGVMRSRLGRFDREGFAVFGDDLIVRRSIAPFLIEALANCGFSLNEEKSFISGPVRESCGTDWYQGRQLRPVFFDETPRFVDELFCDYNRLKRVLELRFQIEESRVLTEMFKWIPEQFHKLKGPYSDEDFGSYIHWAYPVVPFKPRWVYKFTRIVRRPIELKARNLLFRKLMHDLHPRPPRSPIWDGKRCKGRLESSGSRFTVVARGAFTMSLTSSVASYWRSEYAECLPCLVC